MDTSLGRRLEDLRDRRELIMDVHRAVGWYQDGEEWNFWDGQRFVRSPQWPMPTASPAPMAAPASQVIVNVGGGPKAVSGLSAGMNFVHLVLTVATFGLWGVVWFAHARLSRKKMIY